MNMKRINFKLFVRNSRVRDNHSCSCYTSKKHAKHFILNFILNFILHFILQHYEIPCRLTLTTLKKNLLKFI
jgi:hypothetical protein